MKGFYAVTFIITIAILGICTERAEKSKKEIATPLVKVLIMAAITVAGNLFVVLSENKLLSLVSYSIFFVGIDWLLYFLLLFATEYTGILKNKILKKGLMLILIFDSASMLLNTVFSHAFWCRLVYTEYGEKLYRITFGFPYELHLTLCYIMLVITFAALVYKACKSPAFYRSKYLVIVGVLLAVVIGDAVYVFMEQIIDMSILLFAAAGVAIYYYAVEYVPKEIVNRSMSLVVQKLSEGIVFFDITNQCAYANKFAEQILEADNEDDILLERVLGKWGKKIDVKEQDDFSCTRMEIVKGEPMYLRIRFQRMLDKHKQYLGCIFIIHDCTVEKRNQQKEHFLATHDKLTGIYNKEYFYEQVEKCIKDYPDRKYLMVCSDIKDFKLVNDVFGKEIGDDLLVRIAAEIRMQVKLGEVYCRLDGDRFALFMQKKDFRENVFIDGPERTARIESDISYPVNIYVGVYEVNDLTMPVSGMCDRAVMAIESIKGNFEKKVAYYDENLRQSVLREKELSGELNYALETGQFQIYLQPQITADGIVAGAEALVRWLHPHKGLIMPGEFIEIFEKNGMIAKLDQHVWKLACECLRKWKKAGKTECYISVNISPKDFYFMDVYKTITELAEQYDIIPRNLRLEITETAIMIDLEHQLEMIKRLRDYGFIVEMDDFGSGYSSLNMLKDICVDELKVDMAFLKRTRDEKRGKIILQNIVHMSKQLGMPIIIEGVETVEQVKFLKEIGCDMFQGFFFARPVAVAKFEEIYL